MLSIRSEYMSLKDENGVHQLIFTLFMENDNKINHCSINTSLWVDDSYIILDSIKMMLDSLFKSTLPELYLPINKYKKELKDLDFRRQELIDKIKELEE